VTTALTEYPGLEAKAQKVFDMPYSELALHLQKAVRSLVAKDAAGEMLAALKDAEALVVGWACHHAMQGCTTPQEYARAADKSGWHPTHREIYEKLKTAIKKASGQ